MSKEPLSQGPVQALHDALVPVDVNTSKLDLDPVFGEQLAHRTHELASRVNLKELRPAQGAPACKSVPGHRQPLPRSC